MLSQKLQPVQALLLVRPQLRLQTRRRRYSRQAGLLTQRLYEPLQGLGALPDHALAHGAGGTQGLDPGQTQGLGVPVQHRVSVQFEQHFDPGFEVVRGQAHKAVLTVRSGQQDVVGQFKVRLARLARAGVPQGRHNRRHPGQDVDALAAQFHAQ